MTKEELVEEVLQVAVSRGVSRELGTLARELGEYTKGMAPGDAKTAKLMLLEMISNGCGEFIEKMRIRIENRKDGSE